MARSLLLLASVCAAASTLLESAVDVSKIPVVHQRSNGHGQKRTLSRSTGEGTELSHRTNVSDATYPVANMTIGGQQLQMVIDTGSPILWALGPNAPMDTIRSEHIYDPSKSTDRHYQLPNETFEITYGAGAMASGSVWKDRACLGGKCVDEAPVGLADKVFDPPADGIMALGFGSFSPWKPFKVGTFMQLIQGLPSRILTLAFQPNAGGYLEIGRTDRSSYFGDLATFGIDNSTGNWYSRNVNFASNGIDLGNAPSMFVDSGTPFTGMPNHSISMYMAQVEGGVFNSTDKQWRVPCSAPLPDLEFIFDNGVTANLRGEFLKVSPVVTGTDCLVNILEASVQCPTGNAFFFSNVVVFDYDEPSVSFAPRASDKAH